MYNYVNKKSGKVAPLIADDIYEIIMEVISTFHSSLAIVD